MMASPDTRVLSLLWTIIQPFGGKTNKKCYMLRIGSVQHSSDFHLANNPLPEVKAVKDLGVVVDQQLKFDSHINHIVVRASARANLIHKCFR